MTVSFSNHPSKSQVWQMYLKAITEKYKKFYLLTDAQLKKIIEKKVPEWRQENEFTVVKAFTREYLARKPILAVCVRFLQKLSSCVHYRR